MNQNEKLALIKNILCFMAIMCGIVTMGFNILTPSFWCIGTGLFLLLFVDMEDTDDDNDESGSV